MYTQSGVKLLNKNDNGDKRRSTESKSNSFAKGLKATVISRDYQLQVRQGQNIQTIDTGKINRNQWISKNVYVFYK